MLCDEKLVIYIRVKCIRDWAVPFLSIYLYVDANTNIDDLFHKQSSDGPGKLLHTVRYVYRLARFATKNTIHY